METTATDWSQWDDTYYFVQGNNPQYIVDNLDSSTFQYLKLNVIAAVNQNGEIVFAKGYDLNLSQEVAISPDLQLALSTSPIMQNNTIESRNSGILRLPEGPLLYTSMPILNSAGQGPIQGTLLMGRYLDSEFIQELSEQTDLPISVSLYNSNEAFPGSQLLSSAASTLVIPRGNNIFGYSLINDELGQPYLIFSIELSRDIYLQGMKTITWIGLSIIGAATGGVILALLGINRVFLYRVRRVVKAVEDIRDTKDLALRVPEESNDEITHLAAEVNSLLGQLSESQRSLLESNNLFSAIANSSTVLAWMSGVDKRYIWFNAPWLTFTGHTMQQEIGNDWGENIYPDDFHTCLSTYGEAFDSRRPFSIECRLRHHTGEYRWMIYAGIPRYSVEGNFAGYIGSCMDINERKLVEKQLIQSELNLRKAQQTAHVGSWIWHIRNDRLEWSDEMFRIFGIEKDGFTGDLSKVTAEAIHPDDRAAVEVSNLSVVRDGKPVPLEYRVIRSDGSVRTVWAEAGEMVTDAAGKPGVLSGIVLDITERKMAQTEIAENEQKFRVAFLTGQDALFISTLEDGKIVEVNYQFERLFGYTRAELMGKTVLEIGLYTNPAHRARMLTALKTLGTVRDMEFKGRKKYGEIMTVSLSVSPLVIHQKQHILGSIHDITESKENLKALHDSRLRFLRVTDKMQNGLLLFEKGKAVYANQAITEISGYSKKELLKIDYMKFFVPEDREAQMEMMRHSLQSGDANQSWDLWIVRKNGQRRYVRTRYCRTSAPRQSPRFFVLLSDITELKLIQNELNSSFIAERDLRQQLESELLRKAEFSRVLVHELKTPLTPIMNSSEMLLGLVKKGIQKRMVTNIFEASNDLNLRVEELLDLAKMEGGVFKMNFQPSNVAKVINNVIATMEPVASKKNQVLETCLPRSIPPAKVDQVRLRQVLMNLITNSIKYCPTGAKIMVTAKMDKNNLIVEVEDNGPGISEEAQKRLFNPVPYMQTAESSTGGLGLGLMIAKNIIELHGGRIWCKSQIGKGSVFGFSLYLERQNKQGAKPDETRKSIDN